jgi:hypothetical protein
VDDDSAVSMRTRVEVGGLLVGPTFSFVASARVHEWVSQHAPGVAYTVVRFNGPDQRRDAFMPMTDPSERQVSAA